jgi:riboflavin biosynthesis pyrimidine reductase
MKPYVICHMASSIDGRIVTSRWRPEGHDPGPSYERLHSTFDADAWLIGRITGQDYAKMDRYPDTSKQTFPREAWFVTRDAESFAIVLDKDGRIAWGRSDIGGDPLVVVMCNHVSDAHLAGLRADGVSYIFAGEAELDLSLALEILHGELGINRLLLEGGGGVNGSFLRAGLIDQISLLVCPVVDGSQGAPGVFDSGPSDGGRAAVIRDIELERSEQLEKGVMWLSYQVRNRPALIHGG